MEMEALEERSIDENVMDLGMIMLMEVVPLMERTLVMVLMLKVFVWIWTAVMIMMGMDLVT